MNLPGPRRLRRMALLFGAPLLLSTTACVGLQPQGMAGSAPTPGASGASRLPQLLQQLQSGGAALEIFDGTPTPAATAQSQVLGIQGTPTPFPGAFSGGASTPTTTPKTPTATPTAKSATPTATATPPTATATPATTPVAGH